MDGSRPFPKFTKFIPHTHFPRGFPWSFYVTVRRREWTETNIVGAYTPVESLTQRTPVSRVQSASHHSHLRKRLVRHLVVAGKRSRGLPSFPTVFGYGVEGLLPDTRGSRNPWGSRPRSGQRGTRKN